MALSDYPKASNKLLTPEEKVFIDHIPDEVRSTFIVEYEDQETATFTHLSEEGVTVMKFEGREKLKAVKDYIEMINEFRATDD